MSSIQRLKRNISNDPQKEAPSKKHKARKPFDDVRFKTPDPTLLSQSEVYKLPSSMGSHVSPSDFSPIPNKIPYPRSVRKTSSTNLKENSFASGSPVIKSRLVTKKYGKSRRKFRSKNAGLESPFNSCSSSASSPRSSSDSIFSPNLKRTLSDNVFGPSNPKSASQSQLDDIVPEVSPGIPRRPSVPTLLHNRDRIYRTLNSVSAVDLHIPHGLDRPTGSLDASQHFCRLPSNPSIDWDRPPSRASLFDYSGTYAYHESMDVDLDNSAPGNGFFADVRGTSTPFKRFDGPFTSVGTVDPALLTARVISDTETDSCSSGSESDMNASSSKSMITASRRLKAASRKRMKRGSGYTTPHDSDVEDLQDSIFSNDRSPWISDSLISPPNTMEWNIHFRNAYTQANEDPVPPEAQSEDVEMSEQVLQDMFDSLVLAEAVESPSKLQETTLIPRTRSVDDSLHLSETSVAGARRTRSGTILAPSIANTQVPASFLSRRTRSGTIVSGADEPVDNNGTANLTLAPAPTGTRRTRSGTVVSSTIGSSLPIVEEGRTSSLGIISGVPYVSNPTASVGPGRRSRNGSIVAGAKEPLVENFNVSKTSTTSRNRMRSGSIAALGATIGATLSGISGAGRRTRSGTITVARSTLPPAIEDSVISTWSRNEADVRAMHGDDTNVEQLLPALNIITPVQSHAQTPAQDEDEEDPLNILDLPLSPFGVSQSTSRLETAPSPAQGIRSVGLRARAKAVAKGITMIGLTKKAKGNLRARTEMAMDVDASREDESDDELLLK